VSDISIERMGLDDAATGKSETLLSREKGDVAWAAQAEAVVFPFEHAGVEETGDVFAGHGSICDALRPAGYFDHRFQPEQPA
jgi:hypothetical protein